MFCPRKEVMHHLLQTEYPAADIYSPAALSGGRRILRQRKAALWTAPQPHPALPALRLDGRGWPRLCGLPHPADGGGSEPKRAHRQNRAERAGKRGTAAASPSGLEPGKPAVSASAG